MPLALPLLVVFAVLLSGCAQSSRSSFTSSSPVDDATSKQEPLQATLPTAVADSTETCAYRRAKGIAEVVGVQQDKVLLRFYPGDSLFIRLRSEPSLFGVRVGDEFRSWRGERIAGNCEMVTYQLIDGIELSDLPEVALTSGS